MFFNSSLTKQQIHENEIHLWILDPQKVTEQTHLDEFKTLLARDELNKVKRYRFAKAQNNALITRAFVRSVLALYTGQKAQDLQFIISENGKPELSNTGFPLRFNISHNNNLITCAVCLNDDLGCDIESLSRKISVQNIAKRYFSNAEYLSLQQTPSALQQRRFFELWTLKEAFVKATGRGISQGLDTFSFEIGESNNSSFNDNISLQFSQLSHIQDNRDWYHRLIYPDKTHCVAISVNHKGSNKELELKTFQANEYLNQTT